MAGAARGREERAVGSEDLEVDIGRQRDLRQCRGERGGIGGPVGVGVEPGGDGARDELRLDDQRALALDHQAVVERVEVEDAGHQQRQRHEVVGDDPARQRRPAQRHAPAPQARRGGRRRADGPRHLATAGQRRQGARAIAHPSSL